MIRQITHNRDIQVRIERQIARYQQQSKPFNAFIEGVGKAQEVTTKFHDIDEGLNRIVRQNFFINAITCLEVYIKDTIVHRADAWSPEGLDKLLTINLTLKDAAKLLSIKDATPTLLYSHYRNYSNLKSIADDLNLLVKPKIDFINFINKQMPKADEVGNNTFEEWESALEEMYELRHEFVHSKSDYDPHPDEINDLATMLQLLGNFAEFFFEDYLSKAKD
ncbi:HEPN domain-containing protein [Chryseolinea sp. T2]|uniref:HEPN domain-containing protein n=1 Tax=Chryseolinea sp. T2 TaxID=3129255 RepID=UPI0030784A26